ncbi:MAG TPA: TonB-dependent receptor [Vicinamibacterales bacterium]
MSPAPTLHKAGPWGLLAALAFAALHCTLAAAQTANQQQDQTDQQTVPVPQYKETIEVVGATPIHGLGIQRNKVPSNIQGITAADLEQTAGLHFGEQFTAASASVHVNEAQANPFQSDIQFRGFAGSPLLGLPQGIAIYQDGVRLNEPFGDTVNWELLPTNAIASVNLMPGSNPLFGLNALGGAISVQTKTGFSHPGHRVSLFGGSFGRRWADAQSAGHNDRLSYFVTGRVLRENGWRDFSPSRVRQVFGNVEWRGASTMLNASVTGGVNRLIGNGTAPIQLLAEDRNAIFTYPDETKTNMTLVTLRGRRAAARDVTLDAVVFYRPAAIRALNGDDTTYDECQNDGFEGLLCTEEGKGAPVHDRFGRLVPVDEDDELDGTNNTSKTRTHGWGTGVQLTVTRPLAVRENHFILGGSFDGGRSRYESDTELARLTDERGAVGAGVFDEEAAVRLRTGVRHIGAYVADFFTVAPRLTLTGAARFNNSIVELRDQLGDDLTGDHAFSRLNPSAGLTYELPGGTTAYGSLSVASRVPTPSELSCADPDDPCRLPNAFVADPPLEQVVARTWEGGARGRVRGLNWNASVFRTANRDDITFVSSGALTNEGHFENVGDTLRRGLELSALGVVANTVRWGAAYTYLRATFDAPVTLSSPNHPAAVDGEITIRSGDSLPSVPRHNLKADLSVTTRRATVAGSVTSVSSQFLRGDEANLLPPIESSTIVNFSGSYALHRRTRVVARVTNVFNAAYATFGLLGEADEVLGGTFDDPRFVSPGAPRGAWIGLDVSF